MSSSVYDMNDYRVANRTRGGMMNTTSLRTLAYYLIVGGVVVYAVSHLNFVRAR